MQHQVISALLLPRFSSNREHQAAHVRLSAAVSVNGSVKNIQSQFTEKTPAAGHAKPLCIVADGFPHSISSARTTETQNYCAWAPSSFPRPSPTAAAPRLRPAAAPLGHDVGGGPR